MRHQAGRLMDVLNDEAFKKLQDMGEPLARDVTTSNSGTLTVGMPVTYVTGLSASSTELTFEELKQRVLALEAPAIQIAPKRSGKGKNYHFDRHRVQQLLYDIEMIQQDIHLWSKP